MIELRINPNDTKQGMLKERLESMTISFQVRHVNELKSPKIIDGSQKIEGIDLISSYLDELKEFVDAWYECRCDKYENLD